MPDIKLFLLMCVALGGLSACGDAAPAHHAEGKAIGQLEVVSLDGEPVRLSTVADGKPMVINLWATWCPPCVKELPTLAALAEQGAYAVVAISVDRQQDVVETFVARSALSPSMTVLHDPNGTVIQTALGRSSLPVTYITDAAGVVRAVELGERDWAHKAMMAKINKAIR